jgi:hypothetical protein
MHHRESSPQANACEWVWAGGASESRLPTYTTLLPPSHFDVVLVWKVRRRSIGWYSPFSIPKTAPAILLGNHPLTTQFLNIGTVHSKHIRKNFIRVLAQCRRWHANTRLRFRVLHGRVDKLHRPTRWVVHLRYHISCANCQGSASMIRDLTSVQEHTVLVVECILYIVDGGVGCDCQLKVDSQHDG